MPERVQFAVNVHEVAVEPDYGQFYMRRAGAEWASDQVPSAGYERHLWSDGAFVYVGTARKYGTTDLRVLLLDDPPGDADSSWQHVVEVSLEPGGDLEIFDWPGDDPVATIRLDPGPVRLRACWRGLMARRFEGLDEEGQSDENLLMQLWPEPRRSAEVLRCWEEWQLPPPNATGPDGLRQLERLEAVMERLPVLELVARLNHPYPPMPGGGLTSNAVYRDPSDGSWWIDGCDVRRTLREVTEQTALDLAARYAEGE